MSGLADACTSLWIKNRIGGYNCTAPTLNYILDMPFGSGRPKKLDDDHILCAELLMRLKFKPKSNIPMILKGTCVSVQWDDELVNGAESSVEWYYGNVTDIVLKRGQVWHQVKYEGDGHWHNWDKLQKAGTCTMSPAKPGSRVWIIWVLQDGQKKRCYGSVKRIVKRRNVKYCYVEYDGEVHWHKLHECQARGKCLVNPNPRT